LSTNKQEGVTFILETLQRTGILTRSMSETETDEPIVRAKNPDELTFLDNEALDRYVTDTGKILPRKYTNLSPRQQRRISRLIKTGRHMQALL
jgi:small subunit ribosomal protein S18